MQLSLIKTDSQLITRYHKRVIFADRVDHREFWLDAIIKLTSNQLVESESKRLALVEKLLDISAPPKQAPVSDRLNRLQASQHLDISMRQLSYLILKGLPTSYPNGAGSHPRFNRIKIDEWMTSQKIDKETSVKVSKRSIFK